MPNKTHTFDVEVLATGVHHGDEYTEAHLDDMVNNFAILSEIIKPPVKLGHDKSSINDNQPALGWIKALRRNGSKLIATFTDVPNVVMEAIKAVKYRRVSSEVYYNLKHSGKIYKRVLAAVSLLGSAIPEVKDLQDLQAFLSQSTSPIEDGSFEEIRVYSYDVDNEGSRQDNKKGASDMDELNDAKVKLSEASVKLAESEAKNTKSEAELKELREKVEATEKAHAEKAKTAHADELKTFCEGQVKSGHMTPAARDAIVNGMDKHVYSEDSGYGISFDAFKAFMEKQGKVIDASEKGVDGEKKEEFTTAAEELDAKSLKHAAEHKVSYAEAKRAVIEADDDLATRYIEGEEKGGDG